MSGDSANVYLCASFFSPGKTATHRGAILLHEIAHSVLRISHLGLSARTLSPAFFDCSVPLGLEYHDAIANAYAHDLLANCLHGVPPVPAGSTEESE